MCGRPEFGPACHVVSRARQECAGSTHCPLLSCSVCVLIASVLQSIVQVETLGEFGVFFTLFLVGLEFSPEKLRKVRSLTCLLLPSALYMVPRGGCGGKVSAWGLRLQLPAGRCPPPHHPVLSPLLKLLSSECPGWARAPQGTEGIGGL